MQNMILRNAKIVFRIGLVVGVILLMMLGIILFEMKALREMKDSLNEIVTVNNEKLILAQDMRFLARETSVFVRNILLMDDQEVIKEELAKIATGEQKYREALIRLNSLETTAEGRKLLEDMKAGERSTRALWRQVVDFSMSGDKKAGAVMLIDAVRSTQWNWLKGLDNMVQLQKQLSISASGKALQGYENTRMIMVIADCLILLISIGLVVRLASGIVRPLNEYIRTLDSIANGDFSARISLKQQDEIGSLGAHINNMAEHLQANEKELDQYRFHLEDLIEERTGEMNEQRKRFISVLIHDLKGPLVPIIGFSRKLIAQKNIPVEKSGEYAQAIHDASMKLSETIDQISKDLRGGRLNHRFENEAFDIEELLHSVVQSFAPKAETEHLEIILADVKSGMADGELGDMQFFGDPAKMRTLLENLIGNAVKYARSRIHVSLTLEGGFLQFVVEDDGAGIPEGYYDKIFEEYFQIPSSKEGSGVGLYSAKKIVEHYKGEIGVGASRYGGARFTVRLPYVA